MKSFSRKASSKVRPLALGMLSAAATTSASAAINVVTLAPAKSVTFSHLGSDEWGLTELKGATILGLGRSSGDGILGQIVTFDDGSAIWTQGSDITPNVHTNTSRSYIDTGILVQGAELGLNYVRLDLNNDQTYETVVQMNFGSTIASSDDFITAYAYDTDGLNLEISTAVGEIVPEPAHAGLVGGFIAIGLTALRRRR